MAINQALMQHMLAQMQYNQMAGMQNMPWGIAAAQAAGGLAAAGAMLPKRPPPDPLVAAGMKVEDLIGWRIWRVKNGHLWSYSADYAWMPGEVSEGVPGDHDGAGIWAFKNKRRAFQKAVDAGSGYVWGSVLLWGHVVEHAEGYRASKARILSIGGATQDVSREDLVALCEIHGLPVPAHVPRVRSAPEKLAVEYGERSAYVVEPRLPAPPDDTIFDTLWISGRIVCFTLATILLVWLLQS